MVSKCCRSLLCKRWYQWNRSSFSFSPGCKEELLCPLFWPRLEYNGYFCCLRINLYRPWRFFLSICRYFHYQKYSFSGRQLFGRTLSASTEEIFTEQECEDPWINLQTPQVNKVPMGTNMELLPFFLFLFCCVWYHLQRLPIVSANSDYKLSKKVLLRSSSYYAACNKAEESLALLDETLQEL